jgi:hypothetical protein
MNRSKYFIKSTTRLQNFQQFCHLSKHFLSLKRSIAMLRSSRLLLLACSYVYCGSEAAADVPRFCSTAAGLALAGAETCLHATTANPAAWDGSPYRYVQFSYARPFGLAELAEHHISLTLQTFSQKWDAAITHSGFSQVQETCIRLSSSLRFWHSLRAGLTVVYNRLAVIRYGQSGSCWLDAGLYWPLRRDAAIGLSVQHMQQNIPDHRRQPLPMIWRAGLRLHPYRILTLYSDLYKESPFPADARIGMEWQYDSRLCLRLGLAAAPVRSSFGFGVTLKQLRTDYGGSAHQDLGWSHQLTLRLFF